MVFDPAIHDNSSVVTLTRASVARERMAYPALGWHSIYLTQAERRFIRVALGGMTISDFFRRAICVAAGLPTSDPSTVKTPRSAGTRVRFFLSREERTAVDAVLRGRDLTAWFKDAVRHAAGMRNTRWTKCADAVLVSDFRRAGLPELQRALPGRTPKAIWHHAVNDLGLDPHITDERMSVHQAVVWSGFGAATLLSILAKAGVPLVTKAGSGNEVTQREHIVRRADVVRALKAYNETETIQHAAVRLGVDPTRLRTKLVDAGHVKPSGQRYWRLPSTVIDNVVAAWRKSRKWRAIGVPFIANEDRPRGEANGRSKLTEADVREIRRRRGAGEPRASVAQAFRVSPTVVGLVVAGRIWAHVPIGDPIDTQLNTTEGG